jgi:hypothetical protein
MLANSVENNYKIQTYWARGMAQVVECLPSKCKALSSNSSTAKKKKKQLIVERLLKHF